MKSKSRVCGDAACGRQKIVGRTGSAHLWSSPCRRFAGPYFLFDGRQQSRLMVDSRIFVSEGAAAGFSSPRVSFCHASFSFFSAVEYICISPSNLLVQASSLALSKLSKRWHVYCRAWDSLISRLVWGWSRMGRLMDGRIEQGGEEIRDGRRTQKEKARRIVTVEQSRVDGFNSVGPT